MKVRYLLPVMGLFVMASTLKAAETSPSSAPSTEQAVTANNDFAIHLFKQVTQQPGNLCIAPFSIASALEMASTGAGGETAKQMRAVLHWTQPADQLPDAAHALLSAVVPRKPAPDQGSGNGHEAQLSIANQLYGQTGFEFRPAFLEVTRSKFGAGLREVDFINHPHEASDLINQWTAEQTNYRIKDAVPTSVITPATRLMLINAIFFKADWMETFDKNLTQQLPFLVNGTGSKEVPLMQQKRSFNYYENGLLQLAEVPYQGDYSMLILLPRDRAGLAAVEKDLSLDQLNGSIAGLKPQLLELSLPKFRTEGSFELNAVLAKLGMPDAFESNADFSQMCSSHRLQIDHVLHKTYIQVDENGTEAAAVTTVAMGLAAMAPVRPIEPVVFKADHPFLYVIRHQSTGTILFMGRVTEP